MRLLKIILIVLCSGLLIISCSKEDPVYHDTNGQVVQLTKLKGKWIIVNYWAVWCGACIEEIPELNRFYTENKDKNILMFGVDFDHSSDVDLKIAIKKMPIIFPILLDDPNQAWGLSDVNVLPTTFIINPKGKLVKKIVGVSTTESLTTTFKTLQNE